jgi:hypothetical protein
VRALCNACFAKRPEPRFELTYGILCPCVCGECGALCEKPDLHIVTWPGETIKTQPEPPLEGYSYRVSTLPSRAYLDPRVKK